MSHVFHFIRSNMVFVVTGFLKNKASNRNVNWGCVR